MQRRRFAKLGVFYEKMALKSVIMGNVLVGIEFPMTTANKIEVIPPQP
jgi:hypothetical protein